MGKFQKQKEKKTVGKYLRLGVLAVLVVGLAVMPMLASHRKAAEGSQASVLSATVEYRNIETQIIGGGQLSSEASLNIRIPENVKLTGYLVGNGDTVKKGEPIAGVDKVSVMTAITEVQETLDYLAAEIAAASDDTASTGVRALAGGRVKVIYAKEGESVQDVMLDHGALAVLSLDDTMAVKIEQETTLNVGDPVCVTFSDGTEVDGRVKTNLEGVLTITMDDDDYSVGAKVTVTTQEGDRLGTGELYIFSPWSATAYSGTISDILVAENDTVAIGRSLFSLEDTGNSAQFQRLVDQRQEYEELMQELFTMYRTETITAPCDGIVTGVDEGAALLLAAEGQGWFVNLLASFEREEEAGFVAYPVKVTEEEGKTSLMIDPEAILIPDMAELSSISTELSSVTAKLDDCGNIPIYTQDEQGLLQNAGTAKTGDTLLAVGDEEQIHWLVDPDGSDSEEEDSDKDDDDPNLPEDSGEDDSDTDEDGSKEEDNPDTDEDGSKEEDNPDTGEDGSNDGTDSDQEGSDGTEDGTAEEAEFQLGYAAQVTEMKDGWAKVKQTPYCYLITDLSSLPKVSVSAADLTVEKEYTGDLIKSSELAVGDTLLIVVNNRGTVKLVSKEAIQESQNTPGQQSGTNTGGTPSGGGAAGGGMGGNGSAQSFEPYSLEKLTAAAVTSQEHMTVSITVDELDITRIYVGQAAVVSVDALGGAQFEAEITKISNSGENEGGNSKFTVEVTLGKSGEMLPGMYSSAFITLETRENIPCVPVAALGKEGVDSILYTSYDAENGLPGNPVVVTIGASDGENVEILDGFAAGEVCYYEYYDTYVGSDVPKQQGRSFTLGRMLGGR